MCQSYLPSNAKNVTLSTSTQIKNFKGINIRYLSIAPAGKVCETMWESCGIENDILKGKLKTDSGINMLLITSMRGVLKILQEVYEHNEGRLGS